MTYAIAKLVLLVEQTFPGGCLDLDLIWKNQCLSEPLVAQIEMTAKVAQEVLLSPPQHGANVTEWAKRKDCWERVAASEVALVANIIPALKLRDEEFNDRRKARSEEREESTINAVMEVVRRGTEGFWERALAWRNVRRLLTPTEFGILQTAAKRGAGWAPSDAQAKRLLEAMAKLESDGFK